MSPFEIFRSVEHVWIAWAISTVGAAFCLRSLLRRATRRSPRDLMACEVGAAYTLGFVITIPIFALLICLVVDMTLILVAKGGTMYAAYAGARSAVVWVPSGVGRDAAQEKARLAAVQAMVPFASGAKAHQPSTSIPPFAAEYVAAHRRYAANPAQDGYLTAKCRYAAWAVGVTVEGGDVPERNVRLSLDYKTPFHLPGIGRLFGAQQSAGGPFVMNVRTVVELESHAPRGSNPSGGSTSDPARPLGIRYVPSVD